MRGVIYTEVFVKKVYEKLTDEGYESDKDDRPSFIYFTRTEENHQFEIALRFMRNRFTNLRKLSESLSFRAVESIGY